MGHKVNPLSFRLPVSKQWQSRWFAQGRSYTENLQEDIKLRHCIETTLDRRAAIQQINIERSPGALTVTILTARPGVVIGRGGAEVEKLKARLQATASTPLTLNIEEIKRPELRAKLAAENIAGQLERRVAFRRAVKMTAEAAMRAGAGGIKIIIAGRLGGAEMARVQKEVQGSIPLHSLRAQIDYAHARAITTYGVIGVKVWIYRGEE